MQVTCDVIKDLLPVYQEGLCTDDTKNLVVDHLNQCPQCLKLVQELEIDYSNIVAIPSEVDDESINFIKGIKRKMRKNRFFTVVISALMVLGLIYGGYTFLSKNFFHVPFNEDLITVESIEDGSVRILNNQNHLFLGIDRHLTERNGEIVSVLLMWYEDNRLPNFFNREVSEGFITNEFTGDNISFRAVDAFMAGGAFINFDEEIVAIYYKNPLDHIEMNSEGIIEIPIDAVLIWEQ